MLLFIFGLFASAVTAPAPSFLDAVSASLGIDGIYLTSDKVDPMLSAACNAGQSVACDQSWRPPKGHSNPDALMMAAKDPCIAGNAEACVAYGWGATQYQPGIVAPWLDTFAAGVAALRSTCEAGLPRACTELARALMYSDPAATPAEINPEPSTLARQACEAGDTTGCLLYAQALEGGWGIAADQDAAKESYERACSGGQISACYAAAWLDYRNTTPPNDAAEAALTAELEQACAGGVSKACGQLADRLDPATSAERVMDLHRQACEGGDVLGCTGLAQQLWQKPHHDAWEALWLAEVACEQNSDEACVLAHEIHFAADPAFASAKSLCEDGDSLACNLLGWQATAKASSEAAWSKPGPLYTKACEGGWLPACTELAWYEEAGIGVPPNPELAWAHLDHACRGGYTRECSRLAGYAARFPDKPEMVKAQKTLSLIGCATMEQPYCAITQPLVSTTADEPPKGNLLQQVTYKIAPTFPYIAKSYSVTETTCTLQLHVSERGVPQSAAPLTCHPLFRASAEQASMLWRFKPTIKDGTPTEADFSLKIKYTLR